MGSQLTFSRGSLVSFTVVALFLTSCAEDRPEKFTQGTDPTSLEATEKFKTTTYKLADGTSFSGRSEKIKTGGFLSRADSTQADKINISDRFTEVNSFDIVSHSPKLTSLSTVPIRGRENTEYEIFSVLEPKTLTVYKIAPKKDIPFQEWDMAKKLADGRLAVPLLGYPVKGYYRLERVQDKDGEPTHEILPVEFMDYESASRVRLEWNVPQDTKFVKKKDVFPKNLFKDRWYFQETIIDTAQKRLGSDGYASMSETQLMAAHIVEFRLTPTKLRILQFDRDPRILKSKDDLPLASLVEIPAYAVAYRPKFDRSLEEEEDPTIKDADKKYVELNFRKIISSFIDGEKPEQVVVEHIELDENYFGFTFVRYGSQGILSSKRVKYAFLRMQERNYEPRFYPKFDRINGHGMFSIIQPRIRNLEIDEEIEAERLIRMVRFNPKVGKIVYHFSNSTPNGENDQWLRQVGRDVVAAWTWGFQKAGVPIKVELDESFDASLGDLRYNVLNFIDTDIAGVSMAAGVGQSNADTYSGEILAVAANVHVTGMRERVVGSLQNYVRYKAGLVNIPANLLAEDGNFKPGFPGILAAVSGMSNPLAMLSPQSKQAELFRSVSPALAELFPRPAKEEHRHTKHDVVSEYNQRNNSKPASCSAAFSMGLEFERIEKACGPELESVIDGYKSGNRDVELDNSVYYSCASKLLPSVVMETTLHEVGHNLGLRHVFSGNTDPANHWTAADGVDMSKVGPYSSVMDYASGYVRRPLIPGKMDIATLRYAYAGQIEMEDGSIADLNTRFSLEQNEKILGKKRRPYRYCTDDQAYEGADPMCQPHDSGSTPVEIVKNTINEFWSELPFVAYRHGRNAYVTKNALVNFALSAARLKGFYDEWRHKLMNFSAGRDGYLVSYDEAAYEKLREDMKNHPTHGQEYAQYHEAAQLAFDFLFDVAKMGARYCQVGKGINAKHYEFVKLHEQIFFSANESIRSCTDEAALRYFQKDLKLASLTKKSVREIGYFQEDFKFSMRPEDNRPEDYSATGDSYIRYDVAGIRDLRATAMGIMAIRDSQMAYKNVIRKFYPNFMDEPQYRVQLEKWLIERLITGDQLVPLQGAPIEPRFQRETIPLLSMASLFQSGLRVPGRDDVTGARMTAWAATQARDDNMVARSPAPPLAIANGYIVTTSEKNYVANMILMKLAEIGSLESLDAAAKQGKVPQLAILQQYLIQIGAAVEANPGQEIEIAGQFLSLMEKWLGTLKSVPDDKKAELLARLTNDTPSKLVAVLKTVGEADPAMEAEAVKKGSEEAKKLFAELREALAQEANGDAKKIYDVLIARAGDESVKAMKEENAKRLVPYYASEDDYKAQHDLLLKLLD